VWTFLQPLAAWLRRLFGLAVEPLPPTDAFITRAYVLAGWEFAECISETLVTPRRDLDEVLRSYEEVEQLYADRGFRTLPIDDFVRHASWGEPLRGVGLKRPKGEGAVLHARAYRIYRLDRNPFLGAPIQSLTDDRVDLVPESQRFMKSR